MTTTIARNATRKIAAIRETYTVCVLRELRSNFERRTVDPSAAWGALVTFRDARLTVHDDHARVTVHGNLWYELREPAPAEHQSGEPEPALSAAALRAAELVRFDPETAREWLTQDEDGESAPATEPRYLDYLRGPGVIDDYYLEQLVTDYCGDEGGPGFGEVSPLFWPERERRSAGQAEGCHITVALPATANGDALRFAGTWKDLGEVADLDGDVSTTVERLVAFLSWVAQETHQVIARSFAAIEGGAA